MNDLIHCICIQPMLGVELCDGFVWISTALTDHPVASTSKTHWLLAEVVLSLGKEFTGTDSLCSNPLHHVRNGMGNVLTDCLHADTSMNMTSYETRTKNSPITGYTGVPRRDAISRLNVSRSLVTPLAPMSINYHYYL